MNHILRDHIAGHYFVVYCDDILIFTNTDDPAEHLLKLTAVLETLRNHELLINGGEVKGGHLAGKGVPLMVAP